MTPLCQNMVQAMCQHGFSLRTQRSYLYVVTAPARYYGARRAEDLVRESSELDDVNNRIEAK